MTMRAEEFLVSRWHELREEHMRFQPAWRQIADFMRPDRDDWRRMWTGQELAPFTPPIITDSSAMIAVDHLTAGIFGFMSSPANRWFALKTPDEDLNEFAAVKEWLQRETDRTLDTFAPAHSNFYSQVSELYADIPTFGWGCMFDEEVPGRPGTYFERAFPWSEIYIDVDQFGRVDTIYRHYWQRPRQLAQRFGAENLSENTRQKLEKHRVGQVEMLHVVYPQTDFMPQRLGIEGFPYIDVNLEVSGKHQVSATGRFELPYQVPRWAGTRKYGYGLGRRNLPDTKTINAMDLSLLEASEFQARPALMAPDEESIDGLRAVPRGIMYGTMSKQGRRLVDFLSPTGNLPFTQTELENRKSQVREAWLFSLFQVTNRTGLNELEVLGMNEDKMRLMGPSLARQQIEFLSPKITRRFNQRLRAGEVSTPPDELQDQDLVIEFVSPMAKALAASEAQSVLRFTRSVAEISTVDPDARHVLNGEMAARAVGDGFGVPVGVINSPEEIEARRETERRQRQIQAALEAGEQGSNIAKNLGVTAPNVQAEQ